MPSQQHEALLELFRNRLTLALNDMAIANYEYQSEFARRYFAQGMAEGKADLLARQLARRFGPLPEAALARLAGASVVELDTIGERLLTVPSLHEALGDLG